MGDTSPHPKKMMTNSDPTGHISPQALYFPVYKRLFTRHQILLAILRVGLDDCLHFTG